MFKKHRTLLIALFVLLAGVFACCIYVGNGYVTREATAQINGYRIDFEYDWDMEFFKTLLKVPRPDGKSAETMRRMQRSSCSQ